MLALFGSLDGTSLALSFLAQRHLRAGTQELPGENCSLLPVKVLGQSISVINHLSQYLTDAEEQTVGVQPQLREKTLLSWWNFTFLSWKVFKMTISRYV